MSYPPPYPSSYPSHPPPPHHPSYPPPPHQTGYRISSPYQQPQLEDPFRLFFRAHLATLTVNSRPIIQFLTQVAADQVADYGKAIVISEELVRRINEAPPTQKLPPFYLLDSISKNFPAPYASLFPPHLTTLFLATYRAVDGSTKSKMEEMLKTWRNGGATGREVFGAEVQRSVEGDIWGRDVAQQLPVPPSSFSAYAPSPQHYPPPPPPTLPIQHQYPPHAQSPFPISFPPPSNAPLPPVPTKSALLASLHSALASKTRALVLNSSDGEARRQIDVLKQLQAIVAGPGHISEGDLRAIEGQLREIDPAGRGGSAAPLMAGMPPPTLAVSSPHQQHAFPNGPPPSLPAAAAAAPAIAANPFALSADIFSLITGALDTVQRSASSTPVHPSSVSASTSPNLEPQPLVSGEAATIDLSVPSPPNSPPRVAQPEIIELLDDDENEGEKPEEVIEEPDDYEKMILGLGLDLGKLDLKAPLPRTSIILSSLLPNQCRQCGLRASGSRKGKERLDTHLDWHYRLNKRSRESEGRGNSRAWFVDAKDWISSHHASPDSLPPPSTSNPNASGSSSSANSNNPHSRFVSTSNPIVNGGLTPSQRAALTRKFVIRPSDPEKAARPCAICREGFEGEFREDEEEWVWGNAVVGADGNICHATCYHDSTHSSSIASRLVSANASTNTPPPPPASSLPSSSSAISPLKPTVSPSSKALSEPATTNVKSEPIDEAGLGAGGGAGAGDEALSRSGSVLGKRKSPALSAKGLREGGDVGKEEQKMDEGGHLQIDGEGEGGGDAKRVKLEEGVEDKQPVAAATEDRGEEEQVNGTGNLDDEEEMDGVDDVEEALSSLVEDS